MSGILKVKDKDGNWIDINVIKGEDGKSAYEQAKEGGYTGTEEEFINALNGTIGSDNSSHTSAINNPHKVTAEQVGLGKVPNVATNDQTPTYTEASTLENLKSGEKISVAFGKIKKAIADLISHIVDDAKHISAIERTDWNANTIAIDEVRKQIADIEVDYPFATPMPWLVDTLPNENFIFLEGQAISRIDYVDLFNLWGTKFGTGDGSTTFNVPNLSGKTLVGVDESKNELNAIGKTGGEYEHKLTVNEMPSHSHTYSKAGVGATYVGGSAGEVIRTLNYTDTATNSVGGSQAHNNMQPYFAVKYMCKAKI